MRALRGSAWLALVGLLFFLDESGILRWGHSWPLFIILAGVMTVLQRTTNTAAAVAVYPQGVVYPQPGYPQPGFPQPGFPQPGYGKTYAQAPQTPGQNSVASADGAAFAAHDVERNQEGR